jgi:protein-tyrosine phosphatase
MRRVEPHPLWLGNAGDARDFRAVFHAGIAALVGLAAEEPALPAPRDLIYCRYPLLDGAGNSLGLLRLAIQTVAGFVREQTPALVFCSAGMSRSPAIAAAALALVSGEDCDDWLTRLTAAGPGDVSPALWQDVRAALAELAG